MESKPFTFSEFVRLIPELVTAYVVGWMLIGRDYFARGLRRSSR